MAGDNILPFDRRKTILQKAVAYIETLESFLEEPDRAIPVLVEALGFADDDLKHRIILLLGSFAKEEVAWPLYELMTDPQQSEEIRHAASVQLSVTGSFLRDPGPIVSRLLQDLKARDPERRRNAAFALGWENNHRAATALIELLYDPDTEVQQTAVNALSNLRDERVLELMLDRLEHGPVEQKRSILFNLWRFPSRRNRVRSVYRSFLGHPDEGLRFDALILLPAVCEPEEMVQIHLKMVGDASARIRKKAVASLREFPGPGTAEIDERVRALLEDPDPNVRQSAVRYLGLKR